VYPGRYDPALLLKLIKTEGVTFTHGVPTILQMLLGAARAANTDLAGLKMVIGGSELPKALAEQALALGVDVYAGYGMSESAPLLCLAQVKSADLVGDPEKGINIRTKAGMAAPLVDIRLIDTNLNEVPHDGKTPGEVVVRAPWLTQGYVDDAKASEQLWAGGYLHTNDIGVIEPNGYLRIVDRMKDVIKTGGEWVSSLQIEDLMEQYKGVSEAAVIGVKDDKWGERPLALIVRDAQAGDDLSDAQIKAHLGAFADAGVISKFGIPDRILFVKQLPKTSVGKIDKKALREEYGKV
jgi:acyl-CoA synthetase (AMP-forming)/AMP-acid ligase II